ncbi:hypothetical protein WISP_132384 [Willisornis vidua]|uniref:Uncharacterized protein n=1 Tax=Willisornis vidua TaxID=1566151 RepID=A0ABQ9CUL7_9PASS|nr:hypothetical protein WISP_132384 [Willisornis vidua]
MIKIHLTPKMDGYKWLSHSMAGNKKSLESVRIYDEGLLRAVHLPKLLNIVEDMKENFKSLWTEFEDDTWNIMNDNKLLTRSDLDSISGL